MSKRMKYSLTGGTGDVKPQLLSVIQQQGVVNQYEVKTIVLPTPRFGTMKKKSTVFEILRCYFFIGPEDISDASHSEQVMLCTNSIGRATADVSTQGSMDNDLGEANCLAYYVRNHQLTTEGSTDITQPKVIDLTDGAGNGVLVATDKLQVIFANVGATTEPVFGVKILYRMTNVGIEEYVGIVQSQTQF